MWHPCCQNVLAEKALKSIIWQQYLLNRGANKQLHHYRVTHTEPQTIHLGGSYLCQMLFVSDTELGEFVTCHIKSSQFFIVSLQPGLKSILNTFLNCIIFFAENNLFSTIKQKQKVKNKGSIAFDCVITKGKAFNLVGLSFFTVGMVLNATKHPESWKLKWVFQWLICSQSRQAVASVHQRRLNHCFCI